MRLTPGTTSGAPLWLSRPEEVLAHLACAAAEIGAAEINLDGWPRDGRFEYPDVHDGTIPFHLERAAVTAPQFRHNRNSAVPCPKT